MTVPEYLRRLRDTLTDSDDAKRVGDTLSEIAERWEKMDRGLDCAVGTVTNKYGKKACPICYWADGDGHYKTCHIGIALSAARAPLGEKTDQD